MTIALVCFRFEMMEDIWEFGGRVMGLVAACFCVYMNRIRGIHSGVLYWNVTEIEKTGSDVGIARTL